MSFSGVLCSKPYRFLFVTMMMYMGIMASGLEPVAIAKTSAAKQRHLPAVVDASAQRDSEANSLFLQAMNLLREDKHDQVLHLLEKVPSLGTHAMASTDGKTFLPVRQLAILILRAMPADALQSYRLRVDPGVENRLEGFRRHGRQDALREVYEKQFLSSHGDNGAYILACLYLDQEQYAEARRVLSDMIRHRADSDIKKTEILPRLTLACIRSGDPDGASKAWTAYRKLASTVPPKWQQLETEFISTVATQNASSFGVVGAYGDFQRRGRMPALADSGKESLWSVRWSINHTLPINEKVSPYDGVPALSRGSYLAGADLANRMRRYNWRPTDQLLFTGGRLWYPANPGTRCYDIATGTAVWQAQGYETRTESVAGQPGPEYDPWCDEDAPWGRADKPQTPYQKWSFTYRLCRDMSLIRGSVYRIEMNELARFDNRYLYIFTKKGRGLREVQTGNVLTAYDRETGKVRWRIGRQPAGTHKGKGWRVNQVRFLAAPVLSGNRLIVPMEDELGINLVALDENTGMPLWRTRLVNKKAGKPFHRTAATLTVKGPLVYFCSGQGQFACVDATDGRAMWLVCYGSPQDPASVDEQEPKRSKTQMPGTWEEGLVVCDELRAVALPSDSANMYCRNRLTGERLWTAPKPNSVNYFIGFQDGLLLFGGTRHLVAVAAESGKTIWSAETGSTTGRAVLSGREILVPAGMTIWRHSAKTGDVRQKISLQTPDDVPIGNLYITPHGLLAAGSNRLFLIEDARKTLDTLNASILKGRDPFAYVERGRLNIQLNRLRPAMDDFLVAYEKLPKDEHGNRAREEARKRFLQVLIEFSYDHSSDAVPYLRRARTMAQGDEEQLFVNWQLGRALEASQKLDEAAGAYLAALARSADMLFPVRSGGKELKRRGRRVIWLQLAGLRKKVCEKSQKEIDKAVCAAFTAAQKSGRVRDLARFGHDFAGTSKARDAILLAARRLTQKQRPAVALSLLTRLTEPGDRKARRAGMLAALQSAVKGKDKRLALRLIARVKVLDAEWDSDQLDELHKHALGEGGGNNDAQIDPTYASFKYNLPSASLQHGPTQEGIAILLSPADNGTIAAVDLIGQSILWQFPNVHSEFRGNVNVLFRAYEDAACLYSNEPWERKDYTCYFDLSTGRMTRSTREPR